MELILALILFVGMIVSWFVLPGTSFTSADSAAPVEKQIETTGSLQQPA